jgi:hypothetical protein
MNDSSRNRWPLSGVPNWGCNAGTQFSWLCPVTPICPRSNTYNLWLVCLVAPSTLNLQSLMPMGWFTTGHGTWGGLFNSDGIWIPTFMDPSQTAFLWCPAPTAADVAIKLLGYSGHKRLSFIHVFICPCSMTAIWWKKLRKIADILFVLPAGARPHVWPSSCFEPLILGVILPFLSVPPWCPRYTPTILEVEWRLCEMWRSEEGDERALFRELWSSTGGGRLWQVYSGLVRQVLHAAPLG